MGYAFAAVVAAALNVAYQVGAPTPLSDPCRAPSLRPNREAPRLTGPEEITSRVRFVQQPDSPVSVTAIDFSNELFAPEMRDEPAQLAAAIAALKKSEHSQE